MTEDSVESVFIEFVENIVVEESEPDTPLPAIYNLVETVSSQI